ATLSLDLSGDSLHKRGYRTEDAGAPLKENLAAAILIQAGWPKLAAEGYSLIDPMCGSGTLSIEAATLALDIAPGLSRKYFGFLKWRGHDSALWKRLIEEASMREEQGEQRKIPKIIGYDKDAYAVRIAIANVESAGLRQSIHIEKRELAEA